MWHKFGRGLSYKVCFTMTPTVFAFELFILCWFHGPNIISAASNVVFWTFFRSETCCIVCHTYCFCYGGTNMARKMSEKPHSIRLLRWFKQEQENSRKAFEGASMEATILDFRMSAHFTPAACCYVKRISEIRLYFCCLVIHRLKIQK